MGISKMIEAGQTVYTCTAPFTAIRQEEFSHMRGDLYVTNGGSYLRTDPIFLTTQETIAFCLKQLQGQLEIQRRRISSSQKKLKYLTEVIADLRRHARD